MKKDPIKTCAAIMFSDIVGYTAMMGEDEEQAFQMMKKNSRFHHEIVKNHEGKVVKELGDGVLCSFSNSSDAVLAAYEIQKHYLKTQELKLRIGIHFGEIIVEKHDVFGDAVNLASRLQTLGTPDSILFSHKIFEDISENKELRSVSLGKFNLKNVKHNIEIHALANEGLHVPKRSELLKLLESRLKKAMIGGLVLLSLLLLGLLIYHNATVKSLYAEDEKSIAVLPLTNFNQDAENDFFTDGLTEDIITHLSKISTLKVISKASVESYKNRDEPLKQIAESLGVNVILEGSVQRYGNRIRIRVQLIDAIQNENMWAESYDRELVDIFLVQSEIAQSIAQSMKANLSKEEIIQLEKEPTKSFTAYELYLRGRDNYYQYDYEKNKEAIVEFKKAIQIDSTFALAWAGLGDAFSQNFGFFQRDEFWLDSSLIASKKAIALDSNLSDGYKAMAMAYNYGSDYQRAIEYNKKALSLNPNHAQAMGNLGNSYMVIGNLNEALKWQKKAAGLNPKNFIPYQLVGWIYRLLGDFTNAKMWLQKSLELRPHKDSFEHLAYSYIAENEYQKAKALIPHILNLSNIEKNTETASYETAGLISFFCRDFEQARDYFKKSVALNPKIGTDIFAISPMYLGFLEKREGNTLVSDVMLDGATHLYQEELNKNTQFPEIFFNLSAIYAIKGDRRESIKYLKQAKEMNWLDLFMVTHNPIFEDLRKDREFQNIINQLSREITIMKNESLSKN